MLILLLRALECDSSYEVLLWSVAGRIPFVEASPMRHRTVQLSLKASGREDRGRTGSPDCRFGFPGAGAVRVRGGLERSLEVAGKVVTVLLKGRYVVSGRFGTRSVGNLRRDIGAVA
jgi:hypothetical protein